MSNGNLNWIANFISGIADDVWRDVLLRTPEEIRTDIVDVEKEPEGLLDELFQGGAQ